MSKDMGLRRVGIIKAKSRGEYPVVKGKGESQHLMKNLFMILFFSLFGLSLQAQTVNGLQVANANFNSLTPTVDGGYTVCTFKSQGPNVILECPTASLGVSSITGTGNEIIASASTGPVTLSLSGSLASIPNEASGNFFLGASAGNETSTGTDNLAIGLSTGTALTIPAMAANPQADTFIGFGAGNSCTTCRETVAIGYNAGNALIGNGAGIQDGLGTYIGSQAGLTDLGIDDTFIGQKSGGSMSGNNTTDQDNVFIGAHAGLDWTSGKQNMVIGRAADNATIATTGNDNVIIGYNATDGATSSLTDNVIIGAFAGNALNQWNEVFIGENAGLVNTNGNQNTFIGTSTGAANVSANDNTYVGYNSGTAATGADNTFVGNTAANGAVTGGQNVVIGSTAGASLTSGANDQLIGYGANSGAATTGVAQIGSGTNSVNNTLKFESLTLAGGATFSVTGCGTATSLAGNGLVGTFHTASTTCAPVVTTGLTAPTGYVCDMWDRTTTTDFTKGQNTSDSMTTATWASQTVASGDVMAFKCAMY